MKKLSNIILALFLALILSVPALAAGYVGPGEKVEVGFTYEVSEPKYMVEIPATIDLVFDTWVELPVTVSGGATETLEGRKIAITLEDAAVGDVISFFPDGVLPGDDYVYDDFLVVKNDSAPDGYYKTLKYAVMGDISQTVRWGGGGWSSSTDYLFPGFRFFEFTEDGTKNLGFMIVSPGDGYRDSEGNSIWFNLAKVYPNSRYTGWIVFGVKIVN